MLGFYSDDLDWDLVSGFQFPRCACESDLGEGEQGVRCELLPVLQQDREDDLFGLEVGWQIAALGGARTLAMNMARASEDVARAWADTRAWLNRWLSGDDPRARFT